MEAFIKQSPHCEQFAIPPREPVISSPLPSYPWEKVGPDLFELDKTSYLIVVNYFSQFPEVIILTSTTHNLYVYVVTSYYGYIILCMYDMLLYACALDVIIPLICRLCETTRILVSYNGSF